MNDDSIPVVPALTLGTLAFGTPFLFWTIAIAATCGAAISGTKALLREEPQKPWTERVAPPPAPKKKSLE